MCMCVCEKARRIAVSLRTVCECTEGVSEIVTQYIRPVT